MSKASNRNAMPTVAAMVDEIRAQFPSVRVVFASENGIVIDKREPEDAEKVFSIPANYAPMWQQEGKK